MNQPEAWMRRWAFYGEIPQKEKNANGRLAWPQKFKFKDVTINQIFPDDIPLFANEDHESTMRLRLLLRHSFGLDVDDLPEEMKQTDALLADAARYRGLKKKHAWWMLGHLKYAKPYHDAEQVFDEAVDADLEQPAREDESTPAKTK